MSRPLSLFRRRTLTPDAISIVKYAHPGTKDKWYTPTLGTRQLRLTFKTSRIAVSYGRAVIGRYLRLLRVLKPSEAQSGNRPDHSAQSD